MGVKTPEATEGEDHGTQLLLAAAGVGPLLGADQLPQPLVLRRLVPLLVHATRHRQRLRIHVLKHLEQQILVKIPKPAKFLGHLIVVFSIVLLFQLYLLHLLIVAGSRFAVTGERALHL